MNPSVTEARRVASPEHRTRWWRRALVAGVAGSFTACDGGSIEPDTAENGNVEVLMDVVVEESDSGVVVNGDHVVSLPKADGSLALDRFERYQEAGFEALGVPQAERTRRFESWRIQLTHRFPPEVRGDSTIWRFIDHGDASLEGTPMGKVTEPPQVAPGRPQRFQSFVLYHVSAFAHEERPSGRTIDFGRAAFFDDLLAGDQLMVETTGSSMVEPLSAAFAAHSFALPIGGENGSPIDLAAGVPVVRAESSLSVEFDGLHDPARAWILLHPLPFVEGLEVPGARSAFVRAPGMARSARTGAVNRQAKASREVAWG